MMSKVTIRPRWTDRAIYDLIYIGGQYRLIPFERNAIGVIGVYAGCYVAAAAEDGEILYFYSCGPPEASTDPAVLALVVAALRAEEEPPA